MQQVYFILALVLLNLNIANAYAACELIYDTEIVESSLPPHSETYNSKFLKYTGSVPLVFFRKESLPINAGSDAEVLKGNPTQPNEMPTFKLMGGTFYQFFLTGVPVEGKQHLKGWQPDPAAMFRVMADYPPEPSAQIVQQIVSGALARHEELAQVPYYFGNELRFISVKYVYVRDPKYDPAKGCQITR